MELLELGIQDLTDEQIEELCDLAENAARKHVFSKINKKFIETLNISVEAEGNKPLNVTIEIELELSKKTQVSDSNIIVNESIDSAFKATEDYLRRLK